MLSARMLSLRRSIASSSMKRNPIRRNYITNKNIHYNKLIKMNNYCFKNNVAILNNNNNIYGKNIVKYYSTLPIRKHAGLNIRNNNRYNIHRLCTKYKYNNNNTMMNNNNNKYYSSSVRPRPPPPRPPPRHGKGVGKRMSPAEARQAGNNSSGSGKKSGYKKKPKNIGKNDQDISWLGVAAVGTVVSIGLGIAYYSQNGTDHMPSFLKKIVDSLPSMNWGTSMDDYEEPASRLLPNVPDEHKVGDPRGPPVLVLGLEDTLVNISWDRQNGYRVAKRPGVDKFLNTLAMYYEIVIFTKMPYAGAEELIFRLDPKQLVMHKLYKNHLMMSEDGKLFKDLDRLNRDLTRIIVIEHEPEDVKYHEENCIFVKPFTNPKEKDDELSLLIPFLVNMAMAPPRSVPDFRRVLKAYGNRDVGAKYKKRIDMLEAKNNKRKKRSLFQRSSRLPVLKKGQPKVVTPKVNNTTTSSEPVAADKNATANNDNKEEAATIASDDDGNNENGVVVDDTNSKSKGGLWSWLGMSSNK